MKPSGGLGFWLMGNYSPREGVATRSWEADRGGTFQILCVKALGSMCIFIQKYVLGSALYEVQFCKLRKKQ